MTAHLDCVVAAAAHEFVADVFSEPRWRGREHEAVSYFSFGFLQRHCREGTVLSNATQIVAGGCVPGVPGLNPKGRVNKDLVLWQRSRMSCWDTKWNVRNVPMSILEWKVSRPTTRPPRMSTYDIDWLEQFSHKRSEFVGYAVSLDLAERRWRLCVARVHRARTENEWLKL